MQYPWFKTDFNKELIIKKTSDLINKNKMTMGDEVYKLEEEIKKKLKVKHAILTTSGTSALTMASIALNISSRTKVLCTNLTWIATLNPIIFAGAKIKLIDTYKDNQCVNFEKLIREIKLFKPHVVFLVHLNGDIYYNEKLHELKKKMKFMIIEDAAQSFLIKSNFFCGTRYEIGCFSLSVTKLVNMIYGGFCVTNSTRIFNKLVAIRNNGVNAQPENAKMEIASVNGLNFKPSNIHAVVGLINMKFANKKIQRIKNIYDLYVKILSKNKEIKILKNYTNYAIPLYILVYVKNKKKFINFCNKNKIELHYSLRTISETNLINTKSILPNSNFFSKNLLRLPCGPGYSLNEIRNIAKIISTFN